MATVKGGLGCNKFATTNGNLGSADVCHRCGYLNYFYFSKNGGNKSLYKNPNIYLSDFFFPIF
jgi:hypothetical protein